MMRIFGVLCFELINPITPPTAYENAVLETHFDQALLRKEGLNRHVTKLTNESSRNSPDKSTTMSEASTNNISKVRSGRKMRGINEESRAQYIDDRCRGWPEPSL